MLLVDLPDDILRIIKSLTYVSYYSDQVVFEDYNDPLIRWYHNRLRNYYFNRFSEVCRNVSVLKVEVSRENSFVV